MQRVTDKGLLDVFEMGRQAAIREIIHGDEVELYKEIVETKPLTPEEQVYEQILLDIIFAQVASASAAVMASNLQALEQPGWTDTLGPQFQQIVYDHEDSVRDYIRDQYNTGKASAFQEIGRPWYEGVADFQMRRIVEDYSMALIKNISDDMRTAIGREIRTGLTNSRSVPQIAGRIERLGLEPIKVGNRMLSPKERATLIARTETRRASSQGTLISYQQYGIEQVDILTAGDSHVCDHCKLISRNGPYQINNMPVEALLPIHPACGCTYAAASTPNTTPTDPTTTMDLTTNKPYKVNPNQPEITTETTAINGIDAVENLDFRQPREYRVYNFKNDDLKVYVPSKMSSKKQLLTLDDVMGKYRQMPKRMQNQVKTIALTDKWAIQERVLGTHLKNSHIVASYQRNTRNVNIYRNDWMGAPIAAKADLTNTLHHELAHSVDYEVGEWLNRKYPGKDIISYSGYKGNDFGEFQLEDRKFMPWNKAVDIDGGPYDGFITEYAGSAYKVKGDYMEDFAESVKVYMKNPGKFKRDYPRRGEIIELLMGVPA